MEPLLRADEAAKILNINRSTLWRLQREGLITYFRIGNGLRFRASDLERFIADAERKPAMCRPSLRRTK